LTGRFVRREFAFAGLKKEVRIFLDFLYFWERNVPGGRRVGKLLQERDETRKRGSPKGGISLRSTKRKRGGG